MKGYDFNLPHFLSAIWFFWYCLSQGWLGLVGGFQQLLSKLQEFPKAIAFVSTLPSEVLKSSFWFLLNVPQSPSVLSLKNGETVR